MGDRKTAIHEETGMKMSRVCMSMSRPGYRTGIVRPGRVSLGEKQTCGTVPNLLGTYLGNVEG